MIRKHKCLFRTFVHFLLVFVSNRAGTWHLSFVTRSVETPNRGFVCCVPYCKCVGNCNGLATFFYSPRPSHVRFWQRKESLTDIWTLCTYSTVHKATNCTIRAVTSKDALLYTSKANNRFFCADNFPRNQNEKRLDNYLTGVGGIARF